MDRWCLGNCEIVDFRVIFARDPHCRMVVDVFWMRMSWGGGSVAESRGFGCSWLFLGVLGLVTAMGEIFSVCIVSFNIHGNLSLAIWFSCFCQMYLWLLFGLQCTWCLAHLITQCKILCYKWVLSNAPLLPSYNSFLNRWAYSICTPHM